MSYQQGDKVEYRPIGSGSANGVAHSTSVIVEVIQAEDRIDRYTVKNDNTYKTASYQETNIVGKA